MGSNGRKAQKRQRRATLRKTTNCKIGYTNAPPIIPIGINSSANVSIKSLNNWGQDLFCALSSFCRFMLRLLVVLGECDEECLCQNLGTTSLDTQFYRRPSGTQ